MNPYLVFRFCPNKVPIGAKLESDFSILGNQWISRSLCELEPELLMIGEINDALEFNDHSDQKRKSREQNFQCQPIF